MILTITYFKESGKYYTDAEFVYLGLSWELVNVVEEWRLNGNFPGLIPFAGNNYHLHITGEDFVPQLFLKEGNKPDAKIRTF